MRFPTLDSLRGIAALCVVLAHTLTYPRADWAVRLFFVLSGFVLSLQPRGWKEFIWRRALRLLPPVIASVLMAVGLLKLTGVTMSIPDGWTPGSATVGTITRCMSLVVSPECSLNIPLWSLSHEARISLIFPLLVWMARRQPIVTAAVALLAEVFLEGTPHYVVLFVMGILVAQYRDRITLTPVQSVCAGIVGVLLFTVQSDLAQGVGAMLVIVFGLTPAGAFLAVPVLRWLGRISFSLYLVHIPIMLAAMNWLGALTVAEMLAVIGVSLATAQAMYWVVEKPSMWLSQLKGLPFRLPTHDTLQAQHD